MFLGGVDIGEIEVAKLRIGLGWLCWECKEKWRKCRVAGQGWLLTEKAGGVLITFWVFGRRGI